MKKDIIVKEKVVLILCGSEFAILQREFKDEGMIAITLSIPVTPKIADLLDQSGIVAVQQYSEDGILTVKRRDFYQVSLMIELIIDILEKYETESNRSRMA